MLNTVRNCIDICLELGVKDAGRYEVTEGHLLLEYEPAREVLAVYINQKPVLMWSAQGGLAYKNDICWPVLLEQLNLQLTNKRSANKVLCELGKHASGTHIGGLLYKSYGAEKYLYYESKLVLKAIGNTIVVLRNAKGSTIDPNLSVAASYAYDNLYFLLMSSSHAG